MPKLQLTQKQLLEIYAIHARECSRQMLHSPNQCLWGTTTTPTPIAQLKLLAQPAPPLTAKYKQKLLELY